MPSNIPQQMCDSSTSIIFRALNCGGVAQIEKSNSLRKGKATSAHRAAQPQRTRPGNLLRSHFGASAAQFSATLIGGGAARGRRHADEKALPVPARRIDHVRPIKFEELLRTARLEFRLAAHDAAAGRHQLIAIDCPSGETRPVRSLTFVRTKSCGLRAPDSGNIQMSFPICGMSILKIKKFPCGVHDVGLLV
jgi:hypothetical protein